MSLVRFQPLRRLGRAHRRPLFYFGVIVFACWLRRDVLWGDFLADDYAQLGMLDGTYPLNRSQWELFTFSNGDPVEGEALMRSGFYPWWADPAVRISMFRPLASAMIALDHGLFGSRAWAYHLHSLVWWVALLVTVAVLYQRRLTPIVAAAAFALFGCANAHGLALAWICNRSAILATLLALLSLQSYVSAREREGRSGMRLLSLLLFGVALGFGEYALCALGYFLAYEWFRSSDSLRVRARALCPWVGEAMLFLATRSALGLGMQRSGVYVDALSEPFEFARAVVVRVPVLIGDLLVALRSDYWTFGAPFLATLRSRGLIGPLWLQDPSAWRALQLCVGAAACALLLWLVRAVRVRDCDRNARWLLVGSLLSLIPVAGSFPSSRLTLAACVGFAPWVATLAVASFERFRFGARVSAGLGLALFGYLVVVPAMQQRSEAMAFEFSTQRVKSAILGLEVDERRFATQDAIVIASLEGGMSSYLPLTRQRYGRTAPRACWPLSFVPSAYSLERTSARGFRIRFHGQHAVLNTVAEQLFRRPERLFHLGDTVQVGAMRVTVSELLQGKPKAIEVELDRQLEDPSLLFLFPTLDGYQRFRMPLLGDSVVVPTPVISELPAEQLQAD